MGKGENLMMYICVKKRAQRVPLGKLLKIGPRENLEKYMDTFMSPTPGFMESIE